MTFRVVSFSVFFIVFFCGQCFSQTVPDLTIPWDYLLECNTTSPNITGYATASSNCTENVVVTYNDVGYPDPPGYTIIRTWTAMDSCGNTSDSQYIHVHDDIGPTILLPSTTLTWCNFTESQIWKNITDNCDNFQELKINYTNTPSTPFLACPQDYTFSQIWSAVDRSGNMRTVSTSIAVQVASDITWGYLPNPTTVECTSGVYPNITGMAIAFDQCYRLVPVTWKDSTPHSSCNSNTNYQFLRNFTAMRCDVLKSYVQTINVIPKASPPTKPPSSTTIPSKHPPNSPTHIPPPSGSISGPVIPPNSITPDPNSDTGVPGTDTTPSGCPCPNGFCFGGTECVTCQTGFFGSNCAQPCFCQNGRCDDGVDGSGYCIVCKQGYYGVSCDSPCSCTNGVCNDGPGGDGSCLGCSKGYYGVNCQMKCVCKDGICDDGPTGTGVCLKSLYVTQAPTANKLAPFLVGVIIIQVFLFIFFVGLAIGLFLYYRFKTEKHLYGISYRESKNEKKPLIAS